jgi:hypothetical protein
MLCYFRACDLQTGRATNKRNRRDTKQHNGRSYATAVIVTSVTAATAP